MSLASAANRALSRFGFRAVRERTLAGQLDVRPPAPPAAGVPTATLLADQIRIVGTDAHVIVDVGAHHGTSTVDYLTHFPGARVFAFEPDPTNYAACVRAVAPYGERCATYPIALSEVDGSADLHVYSHNGTHSLLEPGAMEYWDERVREVERLRIETRSLDSFAKEHGLDRLDVLKMDIQGAELSALKGAERLLASKSIALLALEVEFKSLYAGQPLFWDLCGFLSRYGYSFFNLYDLHYHAANENTLCWADAIFLSPELTQLRL